VVPGRRIEKGNVVAFGERGGPRASGVVAFGKRGGPGIEIPG